MEHLSDIISVAVQLGLGAVQVVHLGGARLEVDHWGRRGTLQGELVLVDVDAGGLHALVIVSVGALRGDNISLSLLGGDLSAFLLLNACFFLDYVVHELCTFQFNGVDPEVVLVSLHDVLQALSVLDKHVRHLTLLVFLGQLLLALAVVVPSHSACVVALRVLLR